MPEVAQIRESAFRDNVIKIEIQGDTVKEIDQVAQADGLTSAQWIRLTIATALPSWPGRSSNLDDQVNEPIQPVVDDETDYINYMGQDTAS